MYLSKLYIGILLFLPGFFISASAEREFISLGGHSGSDVKVKVVEQDQLHTRLEITVGGFFEETVEYKDKEGKVITSSGMFRFPSEGVPDIPHLNRVIQVPDQAVVSFKILEKTQKVFKNLKVAPCQRMITTNENPDTIPREEGEVYNTNRKFPEELFGMASTGVMRNVRTLKYYFSAFQYNPTTLELTVTSKILVDFIYEKANNMNTLNAGVGAENLITGEQYSPSAAFMRMYKEVLPNYAPAELNGHELGYGIQSNLIDEEGILFLVGTDLDGDIVDDFILYKEELEYANGDSKFHTEKAFITDEDHIQVKQIIGGYPDITYVILIGDVEHIPCWPTNIGCTDQEYCLQDGPNLDYDVIISRFSVKNVTELQRQFEKVIAYESTSPAEPWVRRAFMAACTAPYRIDMGSAIANAMRNHPQFDPNGVVFHKGNDGAQAFKDKLVANFNNINIFTHFGHSSETKLISMSFHIDEFPEYINNTEHFPLMFMSACYIGRMAYPDGDCWSEAMMKVTEDGAPAGCATIFSSIDIDYIWCDPTMRIAFTNKFYNAEFESFGEFCMVAKQINVNWLIDEEEPTKALDAYYGKNLLGDCTIEMKIAEPVQENYDISGIIIDKLEFDGDGPVLFTADQNVEISDIDVFPSLSDPEPSKARILHDFEVLARNQIRISPDGDGFKAFSGSKVHLAIDSDLNIIPPFWGQGHY